MKRRLFISSLMASAATGVFAGAPLTSLRPLARPGEVRLPPPLPSDRLVTEAKLGGQVAFAVADARTGAFLEMYNAAAALPPASVAKAMTAAYGLEHLGSDYRFRTQLIALGPIEGGKLKGDLVLQGGGDPSLDTDALASLAAQLKEAGVVEVEGQLRIYAGAFPTIPHIDGDQPDHVGYNPAISGLNLNYNRVHFEWKREQKGYGVTMQARSRNHRPDVAIARMEITDDRRFPVYTYHQAEGVDRWTVAKAALGREGARWLPVRRPAAYCGEVFQTLARAHGIVLRQGPTMLGPLHGRVIAVHDSTHLTEMARLMLKYSTNLTAEGIGLAASALTVGRPTSLEASAVHMNRWLRRNFAATSAGFVDHSGLGYDSRVSPIDLVRSLKAYTAVKPILKPVKMGDHAPGGSAVVAKTGTLNFVSALAGYINPPKGGREMVFAILSADTARRDAIAPEQREKPPGARGWGNRSRSMQKRLIGRWIRSYA